MNEGTTFRIRIMKHPLKLEMTTCEMSGTSDLVDLLDKNYVATAIPTHKAEQVLTAVNNHDKMKSLLEGVLNGTVTNQEIQKVMEELL